MEYTLKNLFAEANKKQITIKKIEEPFHGSKTLITYQCNRCKKIITKKLYNIFSEKYCCKECGYIYNSLKKFSNKINILQINFLSKEAWIENKNGIFLIDLTKKRINWEEYNPKKTTIELICEQHNLVLLHKKRPYELQCKKCGHIFKVNDIYGIHFTGCPECHPKKNKSIGEIHIEEYLQKNKIYFEEQKKFDNCKYKKQLSFDFYIPSKNILIEYQGGQHQYPVEYFGGEEQFKRQQKRDKIKKQYAKDNGYMLIEITYCRKKEDIIKQLDNIFKKGGSIKKEA